MQTVPEIIDALGGSAKVSRDTGFPLTTIESWKKSGFIPDWRRQPLIKLGKKRSVDLTEDSFPPRPARAA